MNNQKKKNQKAVGKVAQMLNQTKTPPLPLQMMDLAVMGAVVGVEIAVQAMVVKRVVVHQTQMKKKIIQRVLKQVMLVIVPKKSPRNSQHQLPRRLRISQKIEKEGL